MFRHHSHRDRDQCNSRTFGQRGANRGEGGRNKGRFGGRGGGRLFEQGDLRFVILQLIADKPSHGYEIIKAIEEKVAGAYSPSPGVVYPTLTLLEELGQLTVAEGPGTKKLYSITPEGLAALEQNRPAVQSIFARMAEMVAAYGDGPPPQVIRAAVNLRTALRLRLARGKLTEAEVKSIAATLDTAAAAIEAA
jgi:DNA-binding PadR family transcriptional regulator